MPDITKYHGREQAFVKHAIIEKYLERFAIKISRKWDQIVYLDAFAGPWENVADDLSDTSFCIALEQLKSGISVARDTFGRAITVKAYLIEKDPEAFAKLSDFGNEQESTGFSVKCLNGEFEEKLPTIHLEVKKKDSEKAFLFALIDPKGWTGLSMDLMAPLFRQRSAEVLVNVMTSFIHRFADAENCRESYQKFFGRQGVRKIIANAPSDDREDAVVREYCRSLRSLCKFSHVSSAVVLQPDKNGIKYFMVFGTNSPMGIKVFKEAELHAASLQDRIKHEKEMGDQMALFATDQTPPVSESLRRKYRMIMNGRVLELFRQNLSVSYEDVFCKAMALPLVTEEELLDYIVTHKSLRLTLDGSRRRRPTIDSRKYHDRVEWIEEL